MRSLFPKVNNLVTDIIERDIGIACLSEIWEKEEESKENQEKIIEISEMDELKYISNPRKVKRGGGSAIIANLRHCSIDKINIIPPKPLEVVWGLVKPIWLTQAYTRLGGHLVLTQTGGCVKLNFLLAGT